MLKYSRSASASGYTHEGSAPIHPGWLAAFVVAALVGQVSAVALPGMQSESAFIASCAVLAVVVVLSLLLPRLKVSSWVQLLAPAGYLVALALLFKSQPHRPADIAREPPWPRTARARASWPPTVRRAGDRR